MKNFLNKLFLFIILSTNISSLNNTFANEVKEIIVKGARIDTSEDNFGSSIFILDSEEIRLRGIRSAIDAISFSPGVTTKKNGSFGGVGSVRIRGASSSQTLVLIDGIPVNDASSPGGGYNFEYLDTSNIDRIEVLRGSQSTLWGSDAIGGVVNIYTKSAEKNSISLLSEIGSFGLRKINSELGIASNSSKFLFLVDDTSLDGISKADKNDGNVEKDGFETNSYSFKGDIDLNNIQIKGLLSYIKSDVEYDSFGFVTGVQDGDERSITEEFIGNLTIKFNLFDDKLVNTFSVNQSDISRDYFTNDNLTFGADGERKLYRYQGNIGFGGFNKIAFGLEKEESSVNADKLSIDSYFFLYQFQPIKDLVISAGIRNDDNKGFNSKTTRKISAAYRVSENLSIKTSWGEGFKVPTIFQTTFFCCGAESANTNIRPEESTSYDLGFDFNLKDKFSFTLVYFKKDINDQINFSFGLGGYENIDFVESDGFEVSVNSEITEQINLYLNYSYIDSIDGRGQRLINIPKDSGELALTYNSSFNLSGSLTIKYNGSEISTYGNLDSWSRADINLFYKLNNFSEIYFRVENLLDKNYQQVFGYGTPDRSGLIGVKVNF
ncbi:MAG: TonB-dependent receptor [Pseudomonadota bacterium]|nr:TonB-dependent receptor [Pseudomonadota bacterium]